MLFCLLAVAHGKTTDAPVGGNFAQQTLQGVWKIAKDPANLGREGKWFEGVRTDAQDAPVPGIIQQVFPAYHGVAWYWNSFRINRALPAGERTVIHFGAVDYLADVWINGTHVGSYEGGETPFEFDITALIKPQGDNLLAVRVLNPTDEPIDGFVLRQTPARNKMMKPLAGSTYNSGGIMYPVHLRFVPPVNITDIFVRPDLKTGRIAVTLTVNNSTTAALNGQLSANVSAAVAGDELDRQGATRNFPPGRSEHELTLDVREPRAWNLDDPFLYRVDAGVSAAGQREHQRSVRCGFRDFRVVDGWFHLNGKRIFLKSTHTGNVMPIGQLVPPTPDLVRRDLINAKASGFNTVRFISGVGYPEQLDFCDEIGLMVYQESFAAWVLEDSPKMKERFDRNTGDMVRRDRNHPSVTIWGLLNETYDGPVFRHAVEYLPALRALDPTRLVLLSSGRWDAQWSIGSVSNPGGTTWERVWGTESADSPISPPTKHDRGYIEKSGDVHYYPEVPLTPEAEKFIRTLGSDMKPVLLSECGIGSLFNVIREQRHYEQVGARPDLVDHALLRHQSDALIADWKRLGFDDVYPFPEDMLLDSQRLHARQRTIIFDVIRSNPRLNGYNLTGMLDHAMTGEGLWNFWREWKPATFEAVTDGWSSLRWCLFSDAMHVYAGRPVTLEAVLANEEVLKPGEYPARFRVLGPNGLVWEKSTTVTVPESNPLAIPVLRETVVINGPAGEYTFAATLERGGAPTGGRLKFFLSNPESLPTLTGIAVSWGLSDKARQWLAGRGLQVQSVTDSIPAGTRLVLVGLPENATEPKMWQALQERMVAGGTVLFLDGKLFQENDTATAWLPVQNKGKAYTFNDWLYHKECVSRRHPVLAGLQGPGIMDWDYYGPVIPHDVFEGIDTPDDVIAASFVTGHHSIDKGYASAVLMGAWQRGSGRFVLSTPYILGNLDTHPAADRLLVNLILYSQNAPGYASPRPVVGQKP
jgi:hypothetical protein